MNYAEYSKIGKASDIIDGKDRLKYRFFEIMPGLLAWLTLFLVVILSFKLPIFVAIFIILFDIYWFLKTIYLTFHLRSSFQKIRGNSRVNWLEKLNDLPSESYTLKSAGDWRQIYHLVILPMHSEGLEIVTGSLDGLLEAQYSKDKMIVVLAQEQRVPESAAMTELLLAKYGNRFFKFLITRHPADIAGELAGKGSNATWAARQAKEKIIDPLGIGYDKIIVSNLDIDTVVSNQYFSLLAYLYLTTEKPLKTSYQSVPIFNNNIWEAPALARVVSFSATFWHTIQQSRPERLTTFSSHSMPFRALVDIDFWQTNVVSEDSRVFWQCFLRYDGDYRVTPMFDMVSMDANVAPTFWGTMRNVYKQQRRWGYGVENVPYFLFGFLKNKAVPRAKKIYYGFTIVESFHSWATNALMLFMLGWLPVVVGGAEFNRTVLSLNLPQFTRTIMTFALVGLVASAVLSIVLLPPKPPRYKKSRYAIMLLQWILFPITTVLLGAFPGLEAQTRLMLGKYMGFWVTPKTRTK